MIIYQNMNGSSKYFKAHKTILYGTTCYAWIWQTCLFPLPCLKLNASPHHGPPPESPASWSPLTWSRQLQPFCLFSIWQDQWQFPSWKKWNIWVLWRKLSEPFNGRVGEQFVTYHYSPGPIGGKNKMRHGVSLRKTTVVGIENLHENKDFVKNAWRKK